MGKYVRSFIAIIVVLALVMFARNKAAWAANPAAESNQSSLEKAELSVSPDRDDGCDKNKDKKKDKDKCDDDDDDGTVKPPKDDIEVCERGDYSVGGVATLEVRNLRRDDCLNAHTRNPDPSLDQLPNGAGTILSGVLVLELPPQGGKVKICFAVAPGKQVKIYSSGQALKTRLKKGIACADAPASGSYALAGR